MAKKNKNFKQEKSLKDKKKDFILTSQTKRRIRAIVTFLIAVIIGLSYFEKAGAAGKWLITLLNFILGDAKITSALFVIILFLSGLVFLKSKKRVRKTTIALAVGIVIIGISGISANFQLNQNYGGLVGLISKLIVGGFGFLVANIIFGSVVLIGLFIFLQFIWPDQSAKKEAEKMVIPKSTDSPDFKIRGANQEKQEIVKSADSKISLFKKNFFPPNKKSTVTATIINKGNYSLPPIDLLSKNETTPTSGNIKDNSLIIKKTLENFGISVEMAEVNIGPTVTQYAFKPAEGVKLSKITTLSNNLALALAAHPIRIEAPIPGKSLVGIEVPNKIRATIVLRSLIADNHYQSAESSLLVAMGRDVSGSSVYAALEEMPHVLVAGATGTGKTIFLNSLILSLLYKNTPDNLRMIMVDPKRVEFQNYNDIPHLLCPVIYDAQKTLNALNWLAKEMERRFQMFSEIPTRNIKTYNQNKTIITKNARLPYIVLIIDELADLMAAKGRELEAGIVRLAQMARATGIHLVLATQRPSVEVITGLIKANITSRITFQVASQIDSRTVLDVSGAEKLLGMGDMLFLSSKSAKITRIQGPYVSESEVKKVTDWIAEMGKKVQESQAILIDSLRTSLEQSTAGEDKNGEFFFGEEDPLFEDVKRIVLETKRASASFLQRRLRIGYSRAARLIDMLEEKGIVGAADGAKPREVYGENPAAEFANFEKNNPEELEEPAKKIPEQDDNDWQKV